MSYFSDGSYGMEVRIKMAQKELSGFTQREIKTTDLGPFVKLFKEAVTEQMDNREFRMKFVAYKSKLFEVCQKRVELDNRVAAAGRSRFQSPPGSPRQSQTAAEEMLRYCKELDRKGSPTASPTLAAKKDEGILERKIEEATGELKKSTTISDEQLRKKSLFPYVELFNDALAHEERDTPPFSEKLAQYGTLLKEVCDRREALDKGRRLGKSSAPEFMKQLWPMYERHRTVALQQEDEEAGPSTASPAQVTPPEAGEAGPSTASPAQVTPSEAGEAGPSTASPAQVTPSEAGEAGPSTVAKPTQEARISAIKATNAKAALEKIETLLAVFINNNNIRSSMHEMLKNFISPLPFAGEATITDLSKTERPVQGFRISIPCEKTMKGPLHSDSNVIYDPQIKPKNGEIVFSVIPGEKEGEWLLDLNEHVRMIGIDKQRLEKMIEKIGARVSENAIENMRKAVEYPNVYKAFRFRETKGWTKKYSEVKAMMVGSKGAEEQKVKSAQRDALRHGLTALTLALKSSGNLAKLSLFEDDDSIWAESAIIERLFRGKLNPEGKEGRVMMWSSLD